jgi:hypothetical protein
MEVELSSETSADFQGNLDTQRHETLEPYKRSKRYVEVMYVCKAYEWSKNIENVQLYKVNTIKTKRTESPLTDQG